MGRRGRDKQNSSSKSLAEDRPRRITPEAQLDDADKAFRHDFGAFVETQEAHMAAAIDGLSPLHRLLEREV